MSGGQMLGNLDKFSDEDFFKENTKGTLYLPDSICNLETIAFLKVASDDKYIYTPEKWKSDNSEDFINYILTQSIFINDASLHKMISNDSKQKRRMVALSTCDAHEENARTVLLLRFSE